MKNIEILGISKDSIAVILDLLKEVVPEASFTLYPNINSEIKPSLPIKEIQYQIKPLNSAPNNSNKVFFGCATPKIKKSIYTYFNKNHNISKENFLKILHPSSYIADTSIVENGVLIEPHVVISSQSSIGFGVYIKRGSLIGHHNNIGDFSDINPGVTISGKVAIGIGCTIGSGVVIRDNVNIGDNTIIGIGSVVTKNIPANCIAYGNPCKIISKIE